MGALFMFLLKKASRNAYNNDRRDAVFATNYFRHFKMALPRPDTIDEVLRVLLPVQIETIKAQLAGKFFE
ncbi:MAG: hypothetical protein FD181_1692 [Prolixibacteraceae bacterium]|nr:MAG: hypothetical protein FD181_1692 [Prolixibacteraceae bacterium]